jgi:hypothetical protein
MEVYFVHIINVNHLVGCVEDRVFVKAPGVKPIAIKNTKDTVSLVLSTIPPIMTNPSYVTTKPKKKRSRIVFKKPFPTLHGSPTSGFKMDVLVVVLIYYSISVPI